MLFVGIDLAERYSAAVVLGQNKVLYETTLDTGPKQKPPNPWVKAHSLAVWWNDLHENVLKLQAEFSYFEDEQVVWVIEDVYPHAMDDKPVLKLQGNLIGYMVVSGISEAHIITAKTWQDAYGYTKKAFGDSKKWATALCTQMGYEPGLLMEGKVLAKPKTDLRDSFLLATWLKSQVMGFDLLPLQVEDSV